MGGYMGYEIIGYKNMEEFSEKLHSIAFRCTKKECLDLPPESFQRLYVEADQRTKKAYASMENGFSLKLAGEEIEADLVITQLAKLRQITGGMVKNNFGEVKHISNCKLDALKEFVEDKDWSKKLVIFTSFTHEVEMIYNMLLKLKFGVITLTGKTKEKDRDRFEERFEKDSSIQIAIVQIDTGGEGIGMTAADVALFYSPTFSLIKCLQAMARIHRIGQESAVTYINMVIAGTKDEEIIDFIENNLEFLKSILDGSRNYSGGSDVKNSTRDGLR